MHQLAKRLEELRDELKGLEPQILTSDIPFQVIQDFKEAVDHIRLTLWTIMTMQRESPPGAPPDRYALAAELVKARVQRATKLNRDLSADAELGELDLNTPGLADFADSAALASTRIRKLLATGM